MEKGFLKTSVTDGRTDFPREAIGPKVFRRKPITTCDFPRSGGGGCPEPLSQSGLAHVLLIISIIRAPR